MATRIVGVGVQGTVTGSTIKFDREISGDGLTTFAATDRILNLTKGENKALTGLTKNSADRNKVVDATVATIGTWVTGDFYALMKDAGTVTYGTIQAAHDAASASDEVIVFPRTNQGDRHAAISTIIINRDVTIEVDTIGEKNLLVSNGVDILTVTSACTIRDFVLKGDGNDVGIRMSHASGLVLLERLVCFSADNGNIYRKVSGSGDVTCRNCFGIGGKFDAFVDSGSGGTFACENCAALYNNRRGFSQQNAGPTFTTDNCISYRNVDNFFGTITGDNNVSSTSDLPTGSNNTANVTVDQLKMAFDEIDGSPWDWRNLDDASALQNNGKVLAGNPLDFDGRTRDGTTPNRGPTEGFTGFATTAGRQIRARYHNV